MEQTMLADEDRTLAIIDEESEESKESKESTIDTNNQFFIDKKMVNAIMRLQLPMMYVNTTSPLVP